MYSSCSRIGWYFQWMDFTRMFHNFLNLANLAEAHALATYPAAVGWRMWGKAEGWVREPSRFGVTLQLNLRIESCFWLLIFWWNHLQTVGQFRMQIVPLWTQTKTQLWLPEKLHSQEHFVASLCFQLSSARMTALTHQAGYDWMNSGLWFKEKADYDWRSWWVNNLLDTLINLHFECIK